MNNLTKMSAAVVAAILTSSSAIAGHAVDFGGIGGMGIPPIQGLPGVPSGVGGGASGSGGTGGTSHGSSTSSGGSIYESRHNLKLACIVGGTPVEFPNDLWVTNTSSATLIKGMALTFAIPSVGVKGSFILPSNVAPGTQVKIADVFGGAEAGAPCTVKIA